MNESCQRVLESLGKALDAESLKHAESCEKCRQLLKTSQAMESLESLALPSAAAQSMQKKLRAELAHTRKHGPWWRDALVLVGVNILVAVYKLHDPTPPRFGVLSWCIEHWRLWMEQHPARLLLILGAVLSLTLVTMLGPWIALSPRGGHLKWAAGALVATMVMVGLGWRWTVRPHPDYLHDLTHCAAQEVILSAVPVIFALWTLTRRAYDSLRTGVAVLSCAMTGLLWVHVFCGVGTPSHLLSFHVLPCMIICTLALVIRRWLPSRSFAP